METMLRKGNSKGFISFIEVLNEVYQMCCFLITVNTVNVKGLPFWSWQRSVKRVFQDV